MSSLREAGLGPIVGHTTDRSCRVWMRAADTHDDRSDLSSLVRTIGVGAVVAEGDEDIDKIEAFYFRLHRERDRTGVFTAGDHVCLKPSGPDTEKKSAPLKPGTKYRVRVGTLLVDDPFGDDENVSSSLVAERLPDPNVWIDDLLNLRPKYAEAEFRTFPDASGGAGETLAFVIGSCRYPGIMWKIKDADRIFGPMAHEASQGSPADERRPVDFALMVGDQIYADMLNRHVPIGLADTVEEFRERYLSAFGSRKMRKLLRNVPTYMILDDHEIEDNWHQDRIKKARSRKVFNLAIDAYRSYQWSHGPDSFNGYLYYNFECGGYPFFVLDTRTQRFMDDVKDSLDDNHLLGRPALGNDEPSQLERLLRWLEDCQAERGNAPKFIVSSSVFAPNPMGARTGRGGRKEQKVERAEASDSWPAFPGTRKAILDTILSKKVQNVVFLCGDIHCSNVAQLTFSGTAAAAKLKAYAITSSAFYWPFWFADGEPSNFVHDSKDPEQKDSFKVSGQKVMDYTAWNFTQEDNFCRVDVDKESHRITVRPFNKDGELIHSRNWFGRPEDPLVSILDLEPW